MQIHLSEYQPSWPADFASIKAELTHDLSPLTPHLLAIEHIGSTAVPALLAKPIIDILILIPGTSFAKHIVLQQFRGALAHGEKQGGYHHIGTGGVDGRWSFKLRPADPHLYPNRVERNVYVAPEGGMVHRNYIALRDTLRVDGDLRDEYAEVKVKAAGMREGEGEGQEGTVVVYDNVMQYAHRKNGVVRRILKKAGWTDEEVDEKEAMAVRDWPRERGGGFEI